LVLAFKGIVFAHFLMHWLWRQKCNIGARRGRDDFACSLCRAQLQAAGPVQGPFPHLCQQQQQAWVVQRAH